MTGTETIAAITDVVNAYATAMVAGDRAKLERVFFENSCEVGHYEGELLWNSRDAFIRMCEEEADNSAMAWWSIRNLSVHGDIAVAHLEDEWAGMYFDTVLTMLFHQGAWRVVSKVYRIKTERG
jgi:Putative lumazine-binding